MKQCDYYKTRDDGVMLVRTYSTENKYIKNIETGYEDTEAIDVGIYKNGEYMPLHYTYIELQKEIELERGE